MSIIDLESGTVVEELSFSGRPEQVALSPNGDAIAYLLSVPREVYKDEDGASYSQLHVVDLDGAVAGASVNVEAIKEIRKTIDIPIQLGGGIRDLDAVAMRGRSRA